MCQGSQAECERTREAASPHRQRFRASASAGVMSFFTAAYRRLSALDLDEIFSYQTTKEVRMIDFRLGMVCNCIRLIVLVYVVGYVFIYKQGYTEEEKSVGHALVDVNGSTYSMLGDKATPWDAIDAVVPALEDGAAFIATTIAVTAGQTIQNATDLNLPCSVATAKAECPAMPPLDYGICGGTHCKNWAWSPSYSETDTANTTVNELVHADRFGVWLRASIQFPSLDAGRIFSTMDVGAPTPYNGGGAPGAAQTASSATSATIGSGGTPAPDYYTVGELLSLAGTSYETVKRTGCTLSVNFLWKCFVDSTAACYPSIQVSRMDLNERRRGFSYQYAHYYRPVAKKDGGTETRDLYTVHGIRLLVSSRGEGRQTSISAIMLQISSAIALLWLSGYAADFLMLHVLPEKKHYRTYKQERTPDFSDLRNKIAEVEGERKKLRDRKNRFAAKLDES